MKTFEIQRHEKGKWVHDCYLDSPDLAVYQARQMVKSGRYNGVRVIQDEFVEDQATSNASFLFVSKPQLGRTREPAATPPAATQAPPQEIVRNPSDRRPPSGAGRQPRSMFRIIATLVFLIAIGLGAHYGLQTIFQYQ